LAEIAKDEGGNVEKAATGDPEIKTKSKKTARRSSSAPAVAARKTKATKQPALMTKRNARQCRTGGNSKIIQPMLATLVDEPFSSPEWIFETKMGRCPNDMCFLKKGKYRFTSRRQNNVTNKYLSWRTFQKSYPQTKQFWMARSSSAAGQRKAYAAVQRRA